MIGRYFSMMGIEMCTMMKSPKDQVFDWYINRERAKGGKVYERSAGIKPAIKSIRAGASFFTCRIRITAARRACLFPSLAAPRQPCQPCPSW